MALQREGPVRLRLRAKVENVLAFVLGLAGGDRDEAACRNQAAKKGSGYN